MSDVYLLLNLTLGLSWVIFRLAPIWSLSFQSQVTIARSIFLFAMISTFFFYLLPDRLVVEVNPPLKVMSGWDVDSAVSPLPPISSSKIEAGIAQTESVSFQKSIWEYWIWLALLGFVFLGIKKLRNLFQIRKLINRGFSLHTIGRTSVVISSEIAVPFSIWLIGRAYVVLPTNLLPHSREFKLALMHEIQHHRSRDTWWALTMESFVCVFYLNPFAYLWRKTFLNLHELACDEALISQMGISKRDYGSCLLKVAEMALGKGGMHTGTMCMIPSFEFKDHSFLKRRIKMFIHHDYLPTKKWKVTTTGTIFCFLIALGAYFANATMRAQTNPNPGTPEFNKKLHAQVEKILNQGLDSYKANAGFAIVSDPHSGSILAAVNINRGPDKNLSGDWSLKYPLQPASALKPILVATALKYNATQINEQHDCGNGSFKIGESTFHDYQAFRQLSTEDTLVKSSNICTIKIGQKLGAPRIEEGLQEFGFGPSGSSKHFPGARSGNIPPSKHANQDMYIANMSLGSSGKLGFYTTPLEMVQAYGAIANGGNLMVAIDSSGSQKSELIRNILSPQVSMELRQALRKVVTHGTAQTIRNSQVPLAGKTSTFVDGKGHRLTGFIGFAPANNPKLVTYVVLFDPKGKKNVGSNTAAPVFQQVIETALGSLN